MADARRPFQRIRTLAISSAKKRIWTTLAGAGMAALLACVAFILHFNLSSAGSLELLLVIVTALRLGFPEATAASLVAVTGLNFLFIPPIFKLTVADPANWVSLATFEVTALLVSRLSTRVRLHAVDAETQRRQATKLYELSRAILLIDGRSQIQEQLSGLIREIIQVQEVHLSLLPRRSFLSSPVLGNAASHPSQEGGNPSDDFTDSVGGVAGRALRIGATVIGTLKLSGWENDPMLADAIASLAAIAVERARAIQEESRAESERDTEKLRTAVLDGLAHGFKTPLTAIQTASSGLLAIGETNPTQTELISIIDEQAMLLNQLTTKLLQTASLESRQVRLKKTAESMAALVHEVIALHEASVRERITLRTDEDFRRCPVDAELIKLALSQLVDNAVKYSGIGEAITISVKQEKDESTVTIENLGTPILLEEGDKIFERFYRGSNALRGPSGTGLGLSIVRKAVAAHGGSVSVQIDGNRTRFIFIVPL